MACSVHGISMLFKPLPISLSFAIVHMQLCQRKRSSGLVACEVNLMHCCSKRLGAVLKLAGQLSIGRGGEGSCQEQACILSHPPVPQQSLPQPMTDLPNCSTTWQHSAQRHLCQQTRLSTQPHNVSKYVEFLTAALLLESDCIQQMKGDTGGGKGRGGGRES